MTAATQRLPTLTAESIWAGRMDAIPSIERSAHIAALAGVYLGWDGRFAKIGVVSTEHGLKRRFWAYRTHNPSFRFLAHLPMHGASVNELETEEQRILCAFSDDVIDPADPLKRGKASEWLRPSKRVSALAVTLSALTCELSPRVQTMDLERLRHDMVAAVTGVCS